MKYIMLFAMLLMTPLHAGPRCMDNSKHLRETDDTKEWYHTKCYCSCDTIKGGYCIECGHLQDAQTYEVVRPTKKNMYTSYLIKIRMPDTVKNTFKKLTAKYLLNQ
jgi:hypothetical protein